MCPDTLSHPALSLVQREVWRSDNTTLLLCPSNEGESRRVGEDAIGFVMQLREKQWWESTGLEGEDEREKQRETQRRWDCVESCRERDVSGRQSREGAGSRPTVREWPRSGGRVIANVLTGYSNLRCFPQVVPRPEMTNDKDAPTAEHRYEAMNGDTGYTASSSSPSQLVDFEFKDCKTEPGTDSDNEILSEVSWWDFREFVSSVAREAGRRLAVMARSMS